jgi:hypothetical protein
METDLINFMLYYYNKYHKIEVKDIRHKETYS